MSLQKDAQGARWAQRLAKEPHFCCSRGWGAGQALEAFWRDVFSAVPIGARMLEIGCGSADVSLWAAEAGRGLRITASDVFTEAEGVRRHPDVKFAGGAAAEALPFPAASFDLIVSNFAIEYAEWEAALSEIVRTLAPGGSAVLVLHSADSVLTADSRAVVRIADAMAKAEVADRVRRAASLRPDHLSRRKLLKDVLKHRAEIPVLVTAGTGVEYFDLAERLLAGDSAARDDLAGVDREVEMRQFLAREQSRAALDIKGLGEVADRLAAAGLRVQTSHISYQFDRSAPPEKLAWTLFADKPA